MDPVYRIMDSISHVLPDDRFQVKTIAERCGDCRRDYTLNTEKSERSPPKSSIDTQQRASMLIATVTC
jgi:hypothetical protein